VFSSEDVDFLEQFSPAAYKIAMEITDTNLIAYAVGSVILDESVNCYYLNNTSGFLDKTIPAAAE
jgi:hypothetical protein